MCNNLKNITALRGAHNLDLLISPTHTVAFPSRRNASHELAGVINDCCGFGLRDTSI
ncbi:hypothetical protein K443DRAFT_686696 [Laccaria amethystina LaAM-08-1]|uniref:Uncharacterized protein n=1 Tax=Laccaria amethystina LaAM-08-1 TaxID=1095629 RepID=A0A0C9WRQ4_9AGAR|nr:hypothetical protein K443DRAFT_686696 [Laccaria amethystina LaAM-08-1]